MPQHAWQGAGGTGSHERRRADGQRMAAAGEGVPPHRGRDRGVSAEQLLRRAPERGTHPPGRNPHGRTGAIRPETLAGDHPSDHTLPEPNRRRHALPCPAAADGERAHLPKPGERHQPHPRQIWEGERLRLTRTGQHPPRAGQDRGQHLAHAEQHPACGPE